MGPGIDSAVSAPPPEIRNRAPYHPVYESIRRSLDIAAASVLLVLTLPILGAAALAVLIRSGRPVFYGHPRVGRDSRPFRCWKLRTMDRDAEHRLRNEPELHRRYVRNGYKLPEESDPRITRIGGWLRRTYLDELPQLVNVLTGSMSIIGPRPVVEMELQEFEPEVDELLSVRPGIFGLWTSMGRERPGYPERARLELQYVRNRGFRQDLWILARSLPTVLRGAGTGQDLPAPPRGSLSGDAEVLRRVLSNAAALFLAYLLPRVATFGAVVVAARVLGVQAFGAYGTAAALAVILSIVSTLGMMQMLIRDMATAPLQTPRLLGAAHAAKTGSGFLMLTGLVFLTVLVLDYPPEMVMATLLLGVSYAVGSYGENLGAYFQSVERMDVWMWAQAIFGLLTGGLGIALVVGTESMVWFCAAPILGQLGALAWMLHRAPAKVRYPPLASWAEIRRLLRSLVPFLAAFVGMAAYYKVDILLVQAWRGSTEAGLYAAAYRFVDVAQALALVLATAMYPRLAKMAGRPERTRTSPPPELDSGLSPYRWASTRSLELMLLGAIPMAGLLWLLRGPLIGTLFGDDFSASIPVLGFLAPALPVLAVNVLGTFILAARRRMASVAGLYGGGFILNLGLNALLIPSMGARGAALAMLISETVMAGGMLAVLHRITGGVPNRRTRSAALAAAMAPAVVAWPGFPSFAEVGGYLSVVAVLYWLGQVVRPRELSLLRKAIRP